MKKVENTDCIFGQSVIYYPKYYVKMIGGIF